MQIGWYVNSGPDASHLWDSKLFYRLKDAREYANALPPTPIGHKRPYVIEKWELPKGYGFAKKLKEVEKFA